MRRREIWNYCLQHFSLSRRVSACSGQQGVKPRAGRVCASAIHRRAQVFFLFSLPKKPAFLKSTASTPKWFMSRACNSFRFTSRDSSMFRPFLPSCICKLRSRAPIWSRSPALSTDSLWRWWFIHRSPSLRISKVKPWPSRASAPSQTCSFVPRWKTGVWSRKKMWSSSRSVECRISWPRSRRSPSTAVSFLFRPRFKPKKWISKRYSILPNRTITFRRRP